jgi:hypothetical protein
MKTKCQTLILTQNNNHELVTSELRCLRRASGVSLEDKQRNENIWKRQGIEWDPTFLMRQIKIVLSSSENSNETFTI